MDKKIPPITSEERLKAAAIMHAVETESSFKLYAYRIITHDQFTERISELVRLYTQAIKVKENTQPVDQNQTSILDNGN